MDNKVWRKCSVCKKEIFLDSRYYQCSVKSCSTKAVPVQFCSVDCFSLHDDVMGHRDAGAVESFSPKECVPEGKTAIPPQFKNSEYPKEAVMSESNSEILVVVSKTKKYIKDQSDFNTAGDVMDALTQAIIQLCDRAMENAKNDGRKTVLRRDVPRIKF